MRKIIEISDRNALVASEDPVAIAKRITTAAEIAAC
jgi:hypothetical protein